MSFPQLKSITELGNNFHIKFSLISNSQMQNLNKTNRIRMFFEKFNQCDQILHSKRQFEFFESVEVLKFMGDYLPVFMGNLAIFVVYGQTF